MFNLVRKVLFYLSYLTFTVEIKVNLDGILKLIQMLLKTSFVNALFPQEMSCCVYGFVLKLRMCFCVL